MAIATTLWVCAIGAGSIFNLLPKNVIERALASETHAGINEGGDG